MTHVQANKFQNCQDYLKALEFEVNGDFFVKGDVRFPVGEIIGYNPVTFEEKARRRGWFDEPKLPPYTWAHLFQMD